MGERRMKDRYGYCPTCGAAGKNRENGIDVCTSFHLYKTQDAVIGEAADLQSSIECTVRELLIREHISEKEGDDELAALFANISHGLCGALAAYGEQS
jgi:hypothetical protein